MYLLLLLAMLFLLRCIRTTYIIRLYNFRRTTKLLCFNSDFQNISYFACQNISHLLLDQVELDQQKELIAKGYFLANKNDLAVKYASEALVNSSARVPYAAWTAGLASWRLKEYKKALQELFERGQGLQNANSVDFFS